MGGHRLRREQSPYLLQHAGNPVEWYPWGEEAFARARAEDRPVFLSIGYSTCHWCHVMERESFEDPEVARLLNESFVSIKVDREERPEVDAVYMAACQLLTGSGGWPLTAFLTPEGEPFFAGTYFPRRSSPARIGMLDLLPRVAELWRTRRSELLRSARRVRAAIEEVARVDSGDVPALRELDEAYRALRAAYDPVHGGFGRAPKFPMAHHLCFLLRYGHRTGDEMAREMVERTLRAMRLGGIYDHVGFGFHRYSTDARWCVPHFEKMLYDQAMLALAYVEAYQATGDPEWARTGRQVLEYVLRDLRDPGGGFHTAEDADSEGEEGRYYLWTAAELRQVLAPEAYELVQEVYQVEEQGNYTDEATGRRTGRNILYRRESDARVADRLGVELEELRGRLEAARRELLEARRRRTSPSRDDKILTDWNGLAIAALSRAAAVLGRPAYAGAAESAAEFLLSTHRDGRGRLLHRSRHSEAGIAAVATDHAFLAFGLIELYEATARVEWLEHALRITRELISEFRDAEGGGFFLTPSSGDPVLLPVKEHVDGALPSANSVALSNLLRLSRLTGDPALHEEALATACALGKAAAAAPAAHTHFLSGVDFLLGPTSEAVLVGDLADARAADLLDVLRSTFRPRTTVVVKTPAEAERLATLAPYTRPLEMAGERPAVWLCRDFACELPITEAGVLAKRLAEPPAGDVSGS